MKITFSNIAYCFIVAIIDLLLLFELYIDVSEIWNRLRGNATVFSQISPMSDKSVVWYCAVLAAYHICLLIFLNRSAYHKKQKKAAIIAALALVSVALQFLLEARYLYYPSI